MAQQYRIHLPSRRHRFDPWVRKISRRRNSYLGNPMDRGAWQATIHGVAKELDTTEQLNNTKNYQEGERASSYFFKHPPYQKRASFPCLVRYLCGRITQGTKKVISLLQRKRLFRWVLSWSNHTQAHLFLSFLRG